jgi:hypothetical protein
VSELLSNPEFEIPDKLRVVLTGDDSSQGRLGVLFARDGLQVNISNEGQGLHPMTESGRTLINTENGQFLIVRAHILHVDASVRRDELLVTPISTGLRQRFVLTIGRPRHLGNFNFPPIKWILVDYSEPVNPEHYPEREKIPDALAEVESKLIPLVNKITVEEQRRLHSPKPGTILQTAVHVRLKGEDYA